MGYPGAGCSGAALLLFGAFVLVIVIEIKLAVRMARSRLIPALQENDLHQSVLRLYY